MSAGPLFSGIVSPCPFCGGPGEQDRAYGETKAGRDGVYLVCGKCEAGGPTRTTHVAAARAWNRRKALVDSEVA